MNVKKFLLKIESGANTRWLMDDKQLIERIHFYADTLARIHTAGTEPAVLVTSEEAPPLIPTNELKSTSRNNLHPSHSRPQRPGSPLQSKLTHH